MAPKRKPKSAAAAVVVAPEMPATSLVLRCSRADGSSKNGFVWPTVAGAEVVAPDWLANNECGHGLHGWLFGAGDHTSSSYAEDPNALWYVLEVVTTDIVMLGGKCKFPRCMIRFVGPRGDAAAYMLAHEPRSRDVAVIGACRQVGDTQSVIVGYGGTATAGDGGTATAGDGGTATAGYGGTATAGDGGTATAGDGGTATAGTRGTATAGDGGTATAGDGGTATAGYGGTATAGDGGTATAGTRGTATAGTRGTATAGDGGELRIQWWDAKASRYRTATAYVGEDGIKPNTPYRLDANHKFVEAPKGEC